MVMTEPTFEDGPIYAEALKLYVAAQALYHSSRWVTRMSQLQTRARSFHTHYDRAIMEMLFSDIKYAHQDLETVIDRLVRLSDDLTAFEEMVQDYNERWRKGQVDRYGRIRE
jgi:hypothetical protein